MVAEIMVSDLIMILLDGMGHAISWLQSIELVKGVSVWSFIIGCMVVGVVISGLLNLVNRPPIGGAVEMSRANKLRDSEAVSTVVSVNRRKNGNTFTNVQKFNRKGKMISSHSTTTKRF